MNKRKQQQQQRFNYTLNECASSMSRQQHKLLCFRSAIDFFLLLRSALFIKSFHIHIYEGRRSKSTQKKHWQSINENFVLMKHFFVLLIRVESSRWQSQWQRHKEEASKNYSRVGFHSHTHTHTHTLTAAAPEAPEAKI